MNNSGIFPKKEADLSAYFQASVPYVNANSARFLVSVDNQAEINSQLPIWNGLFAASQNTNTRTKTIVMDKEIVKKRLTVALRAIYADVPASVLTTADRNTLHIAQRSTTRTPSPVPVSKPIGQIKVSRRLAQTISFKDEEGEAGKPFGVRGCQIWYKIGEEPVDPTEMAFLTTDTASPHIHHFNGADAGKPVYYWLRWENTRGQTGPWSDPVMANVLG